MHKLEFPHIITVKSSAGAGKTYTLALRYLQLLTLGRLSDNPSVRNRIRNIVAITFTNKAASEMRSRIIDWMKRIILDLPFKGSSLKPIDEIIGQGAEETLRGDLIRAIESDFESLIKNFYDFKVSTIDSFVNLTLKASAFKLDLPPDFDVSTESAFYVDAALQECLQEILDNREVRRKFDAFLWAYMEIEGQNAAWVPTRFLTETVYSLWKEETKENREFLAGPGPERIEGLRKEIAEESRLLQLNFETAEGMKIDKRFLKALNNLSALDKTEFKGSAYFRRETLEESLNKGSAPPDEAWEASWQNIRELLSFLVEALAESKFSAYLEIYGLFKDRLRREVTFRQRLILIEELNKLLQDVIFRAHFIPEIYYALAERYSHFLIDEFQDTNHLQWKNIEILAEEALSRGGTLFLVGDKKQAIYRWRGGKSELVDEIASSYPSYKTYPLCLDINYRSGEHVVSFNNTVFSMEHMASLLGAAARTTTPEDWRHIVDTYGESAQQCLEQKKGAGYVYVEQLLLSVDGEDGEVEEKFSKEEKERLVAEKVDALVRGIRQRRVYEDREIAVLVRRRQEAELIVKKLLEAGIKVDSEFTVNVKNNPLVKEVIAFLHFVSSPHDDAVLAGFLTGTIFENVAGAERDETVGWITRQRLGKDRGPLFKAFQAAYPALWDLYFADFLKGAGYLPLYELYILVLKRWEIMDRFPGDAPYFLHLAELISSREGLGSNNLTGFLRFWKGDKGTSFGDSREDEAPFLLKTTEGADAVKVLTIHKAKGLQFPVVILPFLKLTDFGAADRRDKGKFFAVEEDGLRLLHIKKEYIDYSPRLRAVYRQKEAEYLSDEVNNFYVACTRAEKELYILLTDSERQKNHLIDYIFALEEFQSRRKNNVIEMGAALMGQAGERTESLEGERLLSARAHEEMGMTAPLRKDLRWMEKVRGKFEAPEGCSRDMVYAKKKGDVVHYILSLITFLPEESERARASVHEAVSRGLARFSFQAREKEISGIIARFFAHQPFRDFFRPAEGTLVYTEKEIVSGRGDVFKADRIIVHSDSIDVLDFKTGETRSQEHVDQVKNYGRLLETIHQGTTVRKHLLYIDEERLETL